MKIIATRALFALLALLLVLPATTQAASSKYLKMLQSGDVQTRIQAAKLVARERAFDAATLNKIEQSLRAGYLSETRDRFHFDEMAYYCKALAATGKAGYNTLLEQVAAETTNRNLKRHAANSIKLLADNAERNRVTGSKKGWDSGLSAADNERLQLLRSNQYRLKRSAARYIYNNPGASPKLYQETARQLLAGIREQSADKDYLDAMAWMCKALGSSGDPAYRATLEQVREGITDRKLLKYVEQALNLL